MNNDDCGIIEEQIKFLFSKMNYHDMNKFMDAHRLDIYGTMLFKISNIFTSDNEVWSLEFNKPPKLVLKLLNKHIKLMKLKNFL